MERREFVKNVALGSAGLIGLASLDSLTGCRPTPSLKKPDIVILFADDLGFSDT
jgi:hypothetical protein